MFTNSFKTCLGAAFIVCGAWPYQQAIDTNFMNAASQANLAEIDAGKIASDRAATAAIRAFADQMVMDHAAAEADLVALAQKRSISLAGTPDMEHQQMAASLKKLSGKVFDS